MKKFAVLPLFVLTGVMPFVGCKLSEGGTITIKNDTRASVFGKYEIEGSYSYGSWSLSAGESWNKSVDKDGDYSITFPSWYDEDNQYHDGEKESGSLSGGEEATFYVSSYVPGLEPLADYVLFKNENPVSVTVYSDSAHQNKIADIEANNKSNYLTNLSYYNRNSETHLYLVYHLFGAVDFSYSYDFINVVNFASETSLPTLNHLTSEEKNRMLTNDAYIIVENTSTFSLILSSGANEIPPLGSAYSVLASGKTGAYRVNAGSADSYQFKQNGISTVGFPYELSTFSSGTLYALSYSSDSYLYWSYDSSSSSSNFSISVAGALSYVQEAGN